ncbi:MAG: sugar kinase [Candidatus Aenigmarchaeota archaeon]|nr:sugar kinase [Candidatus Aenigmarchaeota archaeon]
MVELVVVGSIALDDIKTPYGEVNSALGGAAVYSSVAASLLTDVGVVGVVGNDFPEEYIEFLIERGICTKGLCTGDGRTFRWRGCYEGDMNKAETLETELNVFEKFEPMLPEDYKNAGYFFLANIDPEIQIAVMKQAKNPKLLVMDTMNYWIQNKKDKVFDAMEMADIILLNDGEAKLLSDANNIVSAGRHLLKTGLKAVVIKKGEHGALLFTKDGLFSAIAYPTENAKDPTGAGDSFAGGFVGWLAKTNDISHENLKRAVICGTAMASFNIEGFSIDSLKRISYKDIEKRCEELRDLVEF